MTEGSRKAQATVLDRRNLLSGVAALAAGIAASPAFGKTRPFTAFFGPRSRTIYVNDLAGDIDGLFATAQLILSSTSELRGIIASSAAMAHEGAEAAAIIGRELIGLMGASVPVQIGCLNRFGKDSTAQSSPGVQAIIDEAMRTDSALPLYVAVGGGLTEVASAIKIEPKVAERITLIWIGGGSWPDGVTREYNFMLDPDAAQFLFNETRVPIWTIPQAVYSTCIVSASELQRQVAPHGKIGKWLYQKVVDAPKEFSKNLPPNIQFKFNTGETWIMGDNPLAVLTSLTDWVPNYDGKTVAWDRTSAGHYDDVIAPLLNADGTFSPRTEGRKIRIYKDIDTRLMFGDFFSKLALNFPAR
jgi:purine nucleosidase